MQIILNKSVLNVRDPEKQNAIAAVVLGWLKPESKPAKIDAGRRLCVKKPCAGEAAVDAAIAHTDLVLSVLKRARKPYTVVEIAKKANLHHRTAAAILAGMDTAGMAVLADGRLWSLPGRK